MRRLMTESRNTGNRFQRGEKVGISRLEESVVFFVQSLGQRASARMKLPLVVFGRQWRSHESWVGRRRWWVW
jgi:hypothetical protein